MTMIVLAFFVVRFLVEFPVNTPISENLTILRCVIYSENMAYEKHDSREEFIVDWIAYIINRKNNDNNDLERAK